MTLQISKDEISLDISFFLTTQLLEDAFLCHPVSCPNEVDLSTRYEVFKPWRIEMRKQLKALLPQNDRNKFTRVYELFFGKSFRDGFEKKVTHKINQYVRLKKQESDNKIKLMKEASQSKKERDYSLSVFMGRLKALRDR
jgi:hypothetical protein